jgi:hypothetical protein
MEIPPSFFCPITLDLMRDPVILGNSGRTFEREAIVLWLNHHNTDPVTNEVLQNTQLVTNYALRDAINAFIQLLSGMIISSSDLLLSERIGGGSEKVVFRALYKGTAKDFSSLTDLC